MNKRYWVTMRKDDYNKIEDILSDMYERGDIDSVREDWSRGNGEIMLGVQCTSDDLLTMEKKFKNRGVIVH